MMIAIAAPGIAAVRVMNDLNILSSATIFFYRAFPKTISHPLQYIYRSGILYWYSDFSVQFHR
jgi:hypothetical protein